MARYQVKNEIGRLRKLIIHSPDGGIGKIIPSTFSDNLYDDIVHLKKMQEEYNHYVRTLLYFLDPEKARYVDECLSGGDQGLAKNCFIPGKKEYFNSEYVLETQVLLQRVLENEKVRLRLIAAVCSYEESSIKTQQLLESIDDTALLAKIFITGILPAQLNGGDDDVYVFTPIPNFIFTRDIGIMLNDHMLLSRMATNARKRESLLTRFIALYELFADDPSKVLEVIEDSDFFLYEEKERRERVISIEGGDVMMIAPNHLLVGCSERTSANAVNEIVHTLFGRKGLGIEHISVVKIPKRRAQMHIDTIFTQVSRSTWVLYGLYSEKITGYERSQRKNYLQELVHDDEQTFEVAPEILQFHKASADAYDPQANYLKSDRLPGIEALLTQISVQHFGCAAGEVNIIYSGGNVFPHDDREQWTDSCNVVALKEGVVIGYDRNDRTSAAFIAAGYQVMTTHQLFAQIAEGLDVQTLEKTLILLPSAELSRARGGSHCMSCPLLRDDLA